MSETPAPRALTTALWLVSAARWLVPGHRRESFLEEWRTELYCGWETHRARGTASPAWRLCRYALGSFPDATWLLFNEWRWDMLSQDLRYALRSLTNNAGFTAAVVMTLALAIGATTAIFSVVDGTLLSPPPYDEPDGLVMVWESFAERDRFENPVSSANFLEWRDRATAFEALAAISSSPVALTGLDEPQEISALRVSPSFFSILRVSATTGRVFTPEEAEPDRSRVTVITHAFWTGPLGGDPEVVGRTLTLAGVPHQVVGVIPPGLQVGSFAGMSLGGEPQLFLPWAFPLEARQHSGRFLGVLGRVAEGTSLASARDEMARVSAQLADDYPERNAGWSSNVVPLQEHQVGDVRAGVLVLFAAVSLLLLIACVNIANLTLARALARTREVAIRTSLGAAASRIARQLLTESALLALIGGGLGVVLASIATPVLLAALPESVSLPRREAIGVDGSALVFGLAVSLFCGIGFGVLPAWSARRTDLTESLREGGERSASSGAQRFRWLVVTQTALALVLLTGAGLLIRSLFLVHQVDPGLRADNVVGARVLLPSSRYETQPARVQFFDQLLRRLRELPEVVDAGAIQWLPMGGPRSATSFHRADQPPPADGESPVTDVRVVSERYLRTLSIPLLEGRDFDDRDVFGAPPVLLINEALKRQFYSSEDPIGKTLRVSWDHDDPITIVGIVGDVHHGGLESEARPSVYLPYRQVDQNFLHLVVRTEGDPAAFAATLGEMTRAIDPLQPVAAIRVLDDVIASSVSTRRFQAILISVFATAAVLLAGLGIYGVSAYTVNRRRREMGLRMALGASAQHVRRLVVVSAMKLVGIGTAVGLVASFAFSHWLESLLFQVEPVDPLTLASVSVLLLSVAVLGSVWPAQRATKADPLETLRCE